MTSTDQTLRILYLEDNAADADLTRRALARLAPDNTLTIAPTVAAALAELAPAAPDYDVVLADLRLPDGSGLDLLAHIRARNLDLAVVLLTGSGDQDAAVAALKAGADDYLIKRGYYLDSLPRTLTTALERFQASRDRRDRALRVLYGEDNPADVELIRHHLTQHAPHIQLETVAGGRELLALLPPDSNTKPPCDVLLLDFHLRDIPALEIVSTLQGERGLDLPVVLVSDQGSEESVAQALRSGVADYLIKYPGYLAGLPAVLEQAHRQAQLQREQAALRESEFRYRTLVDNLPGVVYRCVDDADWTIQFISDGVEKLTGYPASDFINNAVRTAISLVHPADAEAASRTMAEALQARRSYEMQYRVRHADGRTIWVQERGRGVFGPDGQILWLDGFVWDITEKRLAEERLRLHGAALASSRDAVMITDLTPAILTVNEAFTRITGYSEAEALGQNPRLLASGQHDRAFYQAMWSSLLQSGSWQGEIWNRRKNGESYPALLTISTVRNGNGQGAASHYVAVVTDLGQLRQTEARLQHLTHHDPLTGLPNRLLLEARLQHTLERAGRENRPAAVLVIDMDQFKTINDSLGHAAGDALLVAATKRLSDRLRRQDTLARLMGDQFALVLENLSSDRAAETVAREIQGAMEAPFMLPDGYEAYMQASIGIGLFPQDGATPQELLSKADAAVHLAKKQGGNQFCYYTSELNLQARAALEIEASLRRALEQDEFLLHYQPKVDLRHGRIVGAEALLRWQRPGQEMVPPQQFIPIAEKSGLIVAIGAWVIENACRQIRDWREEGLPDVRVSINVSARQFRSGNLEETINAALARYAVDPGHLTLELTESMLMEETDKAVERMIALKRLGVHLSLDDFGTGYSSLAYLSRFPIDQMKIDRSFVSGIISDPGASTIATAIIALAHRMRIRVVAEGVETEAQLGYLRQNDCDEMQGYFFSRPVAAADFAALLRQGRSLPVPDTPPEARTLLIVDDEPHILSSLKRLLDDEGYRVLTADSAGEGLEQLAKNSVQVILSDQRMPRMSGIEFLGRVKAFYPDTVRIVLSGYADLETVVQAVNEGALYKFLGKPWNDETLREHIRDAFLYYEAVIAPRKNRATAPSFQTSGTEADRPPPAKRSPASG